MLCHTMISLNSRVADADEEYRVADMEEVSLSM